MSITASTDTLKTTLADLELKLSDANPLVTKYLPDGELLHLLRYFEYHRAIEIPEMEKRVGPHSFNVISDRSRESMNFCFQWLLQQSPESRVFAHSVITNSADLPQISKLRQEGMDYSACRDAMNVLWQGFYRYEFVSKSEIEIFHLDDLSKRLEVGEWLRWIFDDKSAAGEFDWAPLFASCNLRDGPDRTLVYDLNDMQFLSHHQFVQRLYEPHKQLDQDWDFSGYSVKEFRLFWNALNSFANVHGSLHNYWARTSNRFAVVYPVNSSVPVATKSEWIDRLTRWSGLEKEKVALILNDITYRRELHLVAEKKKKADASYQPFFALSDDRLALSCFLVIATNYERNMWDLYSILHPTEFGTLSSQKERVWRDELADVYNKCDLRAHPNLKFKYEEQGDVDLLLLDPKTHFGIACELKWLVGPERIKEGEIKKIQEGFEQAEKSMRWITKKPEQVAEKIKMPIAEFQKYDIQPLLLTRTSTLNGVVRHPSIPLVLEQILRWFIIKRGCDLKTAYQAISENRHLPKPNVDFREIRYTLKRAGLSFTLSDFPPLREWVPERDIELP